MTSMEIEVANERSVFLSYFKREGDYIGTVLVLYALLAILLFSFYQYKLYPDVISYVSIAS